jgi:pyruvate carboxylase
VRKQKPLLFTDTTMRDAHQSLLATRVRTYDMLRIADAVAHLTPNLFSLEMWGGATFDTSMRFLQEDPWDRLDQLRARVPNILFQMLLRASNAVGYTNYPDNVVREFVKQSAAHGIDVFRVFDSLNWVENMKVACEAVREQPNAILEAAICYTGDILDPKRTKYSLDYYVKMAKELVAMGTHVLAIKDMAGLGQAVRGAGAGEGAARRGGRADPLPHARHERRQRREPADGQRGGRRHRRRRALQHERDDEPAEPELDGGGPAEHAARQRPRPRRAQPPQRLLGGRPRALLPVRGGMKAGTADVYQHEMPGGQYTNLRQQAKSLGLEERWRDIAETYAQVNQLFGDIVKVTPSSKVVGDLALSWSPTAYPRWTCSRRARSSTSPRASSR